MGLLNQAIKHIQKVAEVPSFSSYEERLHPYVHGVFKNVPKAKEIDVPGNNIIYSVGAASSKKIALAAHLDKINHHGADFPKQLPVNVSANFIEGAMDDSAGVGILLAIAEHISSAGLSDLLFFFSEMEESKGLKERPKLLKNSGAGYEPGMGARRIARQCLELGIIPDGVITIDTTPLFDGEPGIALYSKHWEINGLQPVQKLIEKTDAVEEQFKAIYSNIRLENSTNDYLHYGKIFNQSGKHIVPSVALEPSIHPYHQKGERVFIHDIKKVVEILTLYLQTNENV